jgi:hypothetical protein
MKRKDITKASSVFKKTEQERIGYFHNGISLSSVAVAFREGVDWFIDSVKNTLLLWMQQKNCLW